MSYSAWSSSLHIPHLRAAASAAAAAGATLPAGSQLSLSYSCSCARVHPSLAALFWCKQCQALQCNQCTASQVDTYFCPSCLNSVFTTPAFANQNRCEQCVECPSCFHTLSPTHLPSGLYAFTCEYCRYCSGDFASPAPNSHSTLTAPEANLLASRIKEASIACSPHDGSFASLAAHFKSRGSKAPASSANASSSGSLASIGLGSKKPPTELDGILAASDASNPLTASSPSFAAPGHARVPSVGTGGGSAVGAWMAWRQEREDLLAGVHYPPSGQHAVDRPQEFDQIPLSALGIDDDEKSGTQAGSERSSLAQRNAHVGLGQGSTVGSLVPRRKALATKLAHRCRHCTKFLLKPGPGAGKPNMEIHSSAGSVVPAVTVGVFRPLKVDAKSSIILYFKNPIESPVKLWLTLPSDADTLPAHSESAYPPSTASVDFVRARVSMAAYDEVPEENAVWADKQAQGQSEAEPMLVVYRHLSKVGLLLHVTPLSSTQPTRFVLLVHTQSDRQQAASASSAPATPRANATAVPSTPAPEVHTFALHVNLGFALT